MVNLESYVTYFAEPGAGGTGSFFDYFEGRDVMVYLDEPNRCVEKAEAVDYEFRESMSGRLEKGYILPKQMDVLHSLPQLLQKLQQYPLVLLSTLDTPVKDLPVARKFYFQVQSSPSYNNNFALLAKDILRLKKKQYRVLLLSASERSEERRVGKECRL